MWLTKYNASGNDFLIFHTFGNILDSTKRSNLAKKVCNRHSGIGADGLAIISPHNKYAYQWDFYNSDGSKANMCGNASRCVAHYAYSNKLAQKKHSFLSGAGEIKVSIDETNNDIVEVNFGHINIVKSNIKEYELEFTLLDSGVPHLVNFTNNQLPKHKSDMMRHLREKYNANINFAKIKNKNTIYISTYERGVEDITLACGTGMAAVYYLALTQNKITNKATLIPPSMENLYFNMIDNEVYYKGKVEKICDIKLS